MHSIAPGSAPVERQASTREFLAVLFRRKWLILGLFVATTATVIVVASTTPILYSSTGRVLVFRGERESSLMPGRQIMSDWEQDLGSEMEVVKSEPVLNQARAQLAKQRGPGGQPLVLDAAQIDVEVLGKSNVLGIGYSDRDPAAARTTCAALLAAYMDYRQNKMTLDRPERFFQAAGARVDADIAAKMDERRRIAQETGVTDPGEQNRAWMSLLGVLQARRTEDAGAVAEAQTEYDAMQTLRDNPDAELTTLGASFATDATLIMLKSRILEQQARIASLRERFRDDALEVQNAESTLVTLQALLRKEVDARLSVAREHLATLKAKLVVSDNEIARLQHQLDALPETAKRLDGLDADIRALRDRQRELLSAGEQSRITANTSSSVSVVLLSPAGTPRPENKLDLVRLALAPAFSLVIGIGLAFFVDGLDMTVRTTNQAEDYLDVPVLASLPDRRSRRG
ncbi:MAG TPA: hypothetical protein VGU27_11275 [Candidatus Eisenbacteria bacterium]|nr:hypothetical protein [Candidatus Eisenbacteria bacterium]